MRDCGSEPRCESPIRAEEPQLNTSRYPWLAVGSCRVRDTRLPRSNGLSYKKAVNGPEPDGSPP